MGNNDRNRVDLNLLHPAIRKAVIDIQRELDSEDLPFLPFEGFRTPSRQQALFAQNKPGRVITKAHAWESYHQYGLAVDFVLFVDNQWSWSTSGRFAAAWDRLHAIGRKHGLEPLSFEKPHLQLVGVKLGDLRAGRYPPGGDDSWANNLELAIENWRGSPAAPPPPATGVTRPPLDTDDLPDDAHGHSETPLHSDIERENFERAQEFVKAYEGGFVDDRRDAGGATNFGVTIHTLQAFRGAAVSVADVRNMSYDEAKKIFFANYWSPLKCGAMPGALALAVYNCGVHCGIKGSAEFLQRALNARGASLKVDGDIGPDTLKALMRDSDMAEVAKGVIDLYEDRLKANPHFDHFGKGFLARVAALRRTVTLWFQEIHDQPFSHGTPETKQMSSNVDPAQVEALLREILKLAQMIEAARPHTGAGDGGQDQMTTVLNILQKAFGGQDAGAGSGKKGKPADDGLGPVNGALGDTIGNLLNGRKSAFGIIGSVLLSMLSNAPADSTLGDLANYAPVLLGAGGAASPLMPLFLGLAAWGFLGKMEKWTGADVAAPKK